MKAVLGLMGLAAVLTVTPLAGASDLNGAWKGTFDYNGNSIPVAMNLKVAGTEVTGTVVAPPNPAAEIHEGKVDGDSVSFWVNSEYQGTAFKIVYKGKVTGDQIDFSFGVEDGSWGSTMSLKRAAADAPVAADAASKAPDAPKMPEGAVSAIDVTGVWKGAADLSGTNTPIVLNLKSSAGAVTGTVEGMGTTPIEIHDGKVEGNLVTFWINSDYQGQTYVLKYKGTVAGNQIDFSFGTAGGEWGTTLTVKK